MGIIQRPINKAESGSLHPDNVNKNDPEILFVNYLTESVEDVQRLDKAISTNHCGDFEVMPVCNCGALGGPYMLVGLEVCSKCNSRVELRGEKGMKPLVYLAKPEGIRKMMLPNVWFMIMDYIKVCKQNPFNTLLYLTNSRYTYSPVGDKRKKDHAAFMKELLSTVTFERDFNYFCRNIVRILTQICSMSSFKNNPKSAHMMAYIHRYKADIFVNNLYILHKSLIILDSNATGKYMDIRLRSVQCAIRDVTGIDTEGLTVLEKGNRVSRFINDMALFYNIYIQKRFQRKKGLWKKHIYNMKGIHIARAVIISQAHVHIHNRIEVPWTCGVVLLEQFIIAKLLDLNYTMNEAKQIHHKYTHNYSPDIHAIVKEIISESPDGKMWCMVQRFPTLSKASLLRMYFDDIKINPKDNSYAFPIQCVKGPNADYDGDAMHILLLPDQISKDSWEGFDYHYHIVDGMRYRRMSGTLGLSVQTVINYSGWLSESEINESTDQAGIAKMINDFG